MLFSSQTKSNFSVPDADMYSTQMAHSKQHYLYYFFSTAWINSKNLVCAVSCGRTKPGSPGDIQRFGRNFGNTWSPQSTHMKSVGWDGAYRLMDQNVSGEGESATCGLFVCLFDICVLRMANSVRALYKPMLQGLPEEMFIVAGGEPAQPVSITAFPVLSLHMQHQYQHGNPAFALGCVGVLSHLSLWVPGNEVFLPSQHPLCLCVKDNVFSV